MENAIRIHFAGGKKVVASFTGMEIRTDQSVKEGGHASAPEPYALFLASIGTCAGVYVQAFCDARGIPLEGIELVERLERDKKGKLSRIVLEITVPDGFPEKLRTPLARAADLCAVKRSILNPPEIQVRTVAGI